MWLDDDREPDYHRIYNNIIFVLLWAHFFQSMTDTCTNYTLTEEEGGGGTNIDPREK